MEKKQTWKGLTKQEVEESRRLHGENVLTPPPKTPLWKLFIEKFDDPIIRILLLAWFLSMIIAGVHCWGPEAKGFTAFLEPIGIFFAILLATGVGFGFEVKANKAFDVLNTVNDDTLVKVIRDGNISQISKKEVVVGDIVLLEAGEEIPADGHLLEAISLQINESTLTGEPVISKTTDEAHFNKDATYPSNVVMRGTTVVDGHGVFEVEKVGDATGYGKVYEGSQIDNDIDTPLQIQLKGLAGVISKAGYTIAGLTFVALVTKLLISSSGVPIMDLVSDILNIFMVAVTLIVVSVPEGLPMSVTLSLALSMNRMLKTNNLVRKMHACETMGATTVICTDKTGTLTQNQMQVYQTNFYNLKDQQLGEDELSKLIKEGISANSTAYLDFSEEKVKTLGNPTEAALLLWLNSKGENYLSLREDAEVLEQLTFSTERKYMATLVHSPLLKKKVLYVKGAPEIVLAQCKRVAIDGTYKAVEASREGIEEQLLGYQNQAMRTLGFAYQIVEEGEDTNFFAEGRLHQTDLTYIGIVAISDPVRKDVPEAVESCLHAGIDVKIVTGDTPGTAREIGRQIGIWHKEDTEYNIITGQSFEMLSDEEALQRVMDLRIMCRARPTDKQRLVKLLQKKNAVVAVTGDGTNDAPALKAAQVGLSMGDGTSVAKEASDITILDNSFSSITRAVMWGRSLYRNIQRFLLFQLTINVAACLIVLLGSLMGTESPLTVTQMLWVNLIMDTFAAAALASLPPNEKVMNRKPRKSGVGGDFIISRPMAYNIFIVGTLFVALLLGILVYFNKTEGLLTPYELSMFFTIFVMLQFWNMFNAKAYGDTKSAFSDLKGSKTFLLVALLILVGQYLIVTFGGEMFNVVPLSWKDWGIITATTSVVLWIGEAIRLARRLMHKES
ncbi:Ca2+-transporting ATPase [Parabacteroides sp. PF5-5]|uniref:calcium-translocating P-type ATPase, PMCA-type n=1 Tax=unclassified Parabacteroides TaxID=2649774 RepID=UPI002472FF9E|nr:MULTISPECIES: calcium-translocating P-type ATPase, PMCA-type [unclassified Parabacteroides]MDH6305661.1 Ca2+-transporting ATPase [Parabacteroides sp. PH5-39]MDH6316733.1 Ca2+-transporting ATPase [Parabacteroides sp. PF5-13]MDH6320374.1 Ca2+-transporting ATPase [Parabacteroides sp. PH5-13]MDH6324104.1 Ca2+-transporting ATPase [Parabacteroides sp. PH5-8]MDH6327919.1 Ca2+-transporting ATPase [Parabacteroides sp. PH5-41]